MYVTHFTVRGSGSFPLDMLRYDVCYPADNEDVASLALAVEARERIAERVVGKPEFVVTLVCPHPTQRWTPTIARWRSFGWTVDADIRTVRVR